MIIWATLFFFTFKLGINKIIIYICIMETKDIEKNKWYMIRQYGFEYGIKGQAVDVCGEYVTLRFYWGGIFRSRQPVTVDRLIGECEPPTLFSNH